MVLKGVQFERFGPQNPDFRPLFCSKRGQFGLFQPERGPKQGSILGFLSPKTLIFDLYSLVNRLSTAVNDVNAVNAVNAVNDCQRLSTAVKSATPGKNHGHNGLWNRVQRNPPGFVGEMFV